MTYKPELKDSRRSQSVTQGAEPGVSVKEGEKQEKKGVSMIEA